MGNTRTSNNVDVFYLFISFTDLRRSQTSVYDQRDALCARRRNTPVVGDVLAGAQTRNDKIVVLRAAQLAPLLRSVSSITDSHHIWQYGDIDLAQVCPINGSHYL